jgi:hypothetical protein
MCLLKQVLVIVAKRGRSREVVAESCARHKSAISAGIIARRREQQVTTDSKPLKSKVWPNFINVSKDDVGETVAECNICHKILRAAPKNLHHTYECILPVCILTRKMQLINIF